MNWRYAWPGNSTTYNRQFTCGYRAQATHPGLEPKKGLLYEEHLANIYAFTSDPIMFSFLEKSYLQSIWSQLLGRVFNILRENNPDLAGDRRRTVMRPPQVLREGTKKTVFVNFMDLCKTYDPISFDDHHVC